jgi:dihydroorotate dehydrogenase
MRSMFLAVSAAVYRAIVLPVIFRSSAQEAHAKMLRMLRWADGKGWLQQVLTRVHRLAFVADPVTVGAVTLDSPLILAAGLVKGDGFDSEAAALRAADAGDNIMPGWRTMPRLVGPVEFGSFTRWPRPGNPGTVLWRDVPSRSTQNRVGLKNPGVQAAAAFLAMRRDALPVQFGINVAVSPGVEDAGQQVEEVLAGLAAFIDRGVYPTWFTLNLSCPNTEDDPNGNQTADEAEQLCGAVVGFLRSAAEQVGREIPLWVKVGPTLSEDQYRILMDVFADVGVKAVVATNTLPMLTPNDPALQAGVGGGRLHEHAVLAAGNLSSGQKARQLSVDVIGCGGVQDATTYRAFAGLGVRAVQYWSALVYRGPLVAALIADELRRG